MTVAALLARTESAGAGAVINHCDEVGSDLVAQLASEQRSPLADEIRFEAVADGLVEQDAAPSRGQYDSLRSSRRRDRSERRHRLPGRFAADLRRREVFEKAEADPPAP